MKRKNALICWRFTFYLSSQFSVTCSSLVSPVNSLVMAMFAVRSFLPFDPFMREREREFVLAGRKIQEASVCLRKEEKKRIELLSSGTSVIHFVHADVDEGEEAFERKARERGMRG